MHRTQTEILVEDGLGYCCPYVFFSRFRSNTTIALRLGVARNTALRWHKGVADGSVVCQQREGCQRTLLLTAAQLKK